MVFGPASCSQHISSLVVDGLRSHTSRLVSHLMTSHLISFLISSRFISFHLISSHHVSHLTPRLAYPSHITRAMNNINCYSSYHRFCYRRLSLARSLIASIVYLLSASICAVQCTLLTLPLLYPSLRSTTEHHAVPQPYNASTELAAPNRTITRLFPSFYFFFFFAHLISTR